MFKATLFKTPGSETSALITTIGSMHFKIYFSMLLKPETREKCLGLLKEKNISIDVASDHDGITFLIAACRNSDESLVAFLLTNNADPNKIDFDGASPIFVSAHNNFAITSLLIKHGADINNAPTNSAKVEYTPLSAAASGDSIEIVELLISHHVDLSKTVGPHHLSPLFIAAQYGNVSHTGSLLKAGARVDCVNAKGETPLLTAVDHGNLEVIALLLANGADPNLATISGSTFPMMMLATSKHAINLENVEKILKLLISHGAIIDKYTDQEDTALAYSITYGKLELAQLLLVNGANPNLRIRRSLPTSQLTYLYPIHAAVILNNNLWKAKTISLLCAHKANVNLQDSANNMTALHYACGLGLEDCISALLDEAADPNMFDNQGAAPIHIAVTSKKNQSKAKTIALLSAHKVNLDLPDVTGRTALHYACKFGLDDCITALLNAGANPNVLNKQAVTPLIMACLANKLISVKLMLRKENINVNYGAKNKITALHVAAESGSLEIVKLLCFNNANINACAKDNITPLYLAAQEGHTNVVLFLLAQGVDPNITRSDTNSPLFAAYTEGHMHTVKAILDHMHKKNHFDNVEFNIVSDVLLGTKRQVIFSVINVSHENKFWVSDENLVRKIESCMASVPQIPINNEPYVQKVHAFLKRQGFASSEIKGIVTENKFSRNLFDESSEDEIDTALVSPGISWLNGLITVDSVDVLPIDTEGNKTPNCFYLLAKEMLEAQGCTDVSMFDGVGTKFCAKVKEQGIKRLTNSNLKLKVCFSKEHGLSDREFMITSELKQYKSLSRVLNIEVASDDAARRYKLFIGVVYKKKGLHSMKDKSKQHFPDSINFIFPAKKTPQDASNVQSLPKLKMRHVHSS
jgi:ankyrin repeat protein